MYGWDNVDTEYNMRLNSYSSYVTDFIIHPIQDEKQQRDVRVSSILCSKSIIRY